MTADHHITEPLMSFFQDSPTTSDSFPVDFFQESLFPDFPSPSAARKLCNFKSVFQEHPLLSSLVKDIAYCIEYASKKGEFEIRIKRTSTIQCLTSSGYIPSVSKKGGNIMEPYINGSEWKDKRLQHLLCSILATKGYTINSKLNDKSNLVISWYGPVAVNAYKLPIL